MSGRRCSRNGILDAAEQIVLERGASHMTMDAIAAKAGVSKGGLIYHFPSQQKLVQALLERFIQRVEQWRTGIIARLPASEVRNLKGYILSWLTLGPAARRSAGALLASASREPELIQMARKKRRDVWSEFLAGIRNPERAMILAMAVEGMWMSELLGVSSLSSAERRRLGRTLLRLVDEWCAESTADRVRTSTSGAQDGSRGRCRQTKVVSKS